MDIPETLLEVRQHSGEGYQPLVDFGAWRVAVLRFCDELRPENLTNMQRHDETDEVFVLLAGRCILYLGEGRDQVEALYAVDLAPLKLYNVKQGVWHTHALSEDASVLVVENRTTTEENSPRVALSSAQQAEVVRQAQALW